MCHCCLQQTVIFALLLLGLLGGDGGRCMARQTTQTDQAEATATATALPYGSMQLYRCRQSCYHQFARDWHYCTDVADCRNCWQDCQQQLTPFSLRVHTAQRQGALVLTDIGWDEAIANASRQCLITWEVSGGGLMGNLLTDTARAELSLWPDTIYNIQVTCKHKLTGLMRRSVKLNVDTRQLTASGVRTTETIPTGRPRATAMATSPGAADKVHIISALPGAVGQLHGVIYPAFGALAFFVALLVLFLFLRPQRKRLDGVADTAALLSRQRRLSALDDNSTLHV